jgi:hypothetical protein
VFVRVLLCVRVALDILGSERLGGVDAADDYVFAVRKTVMSRNAWFECVGSKEAWLEDQLCHVCCCLFFFSAEVRSHRVQAKAARERIYP